MSVATANTGLPIAAFDGKNFVEVVRWRAEFQPDIPIYTGLEDSVSEKRRRLRYRFRLRRAPFAHTFVQ